ncbi:MAG TPA: aromatic ring-hydroxylating dioxygenase subunit alpha [Chloroflexota bacterium]|nr:aromatic ring-hydroxylating dioxygenase subunit alpha [Chloroflexota bacterium]
MTASAIERYPDLSGSLEAGYTLPAAWYTEEAVFALEKRRIFAHTWQFAGLVETLPHPGDFFTYRAGDVPIVILRDAEGKLRAFINVCRHRGSELVLEEHGCKQSIQCHYHAWTYGLDGRLRAAPGSKAEPNFDPDEFSLMPAQLDTWGPFIFVNPDRDAPPLAEILGDLPAMVAATGLRLDDLRRRTGSEYDIAANWKIVTDNYLECYHCPVAHPGFSSLINVNEYTVTEYEYFSVQTAAVRASARQKGGQYSITGEVDEGFYAYVWPNFTLNIYPGPGNLSLNLFLPQGVGRTRAVFDYLFVPDVTDGDVAEFGAFIDQVQREDSVLCESVQRGMRSGHFEQGRLMLSRENGLRHFQRLVHRALTG